MICETNLTVHDLTAVGVEHLACHVGRVIGGEEYVASCDLGGLARALHRYIRAEAGNLVGREGGGDKGRPDGAGSYAIHTDALLYQRLRQRACEGHNRAFG